MLPGTALTLPSSLLGLTTSRHSSPLSSASSMTDSNGAGGQTFIFSPSHRVPEKCPSTLSSHRKRSGGLHCRPLGTTPYTDTSPSASFSFLRCHHLHHIPIPSSNSVVRNKLPLCSKPACSPALIYNHLVACAYHLDR